MAVFRRYTCGLLYETVGDWATAPGNTQPQKKTSRVSLNSVRVPENEALKFLSPLGKDSGVMLCIIKCIVSS